MTLSDLLFALLFLFTLVALVAALVAVWRRKARRAILTLAVLAATHSLYFDTLLTLSLTTRGLALAPGEFLWSDDWGIAAISDANDTSDPDATTHLVTVRISSRAGRIAQREHGVRLYVTDDSGARYDAVPELSSGQTDALLQPNESIDLTRAFRIPTRAKNPRLVISRGVSFPGIVIIGGDDSLFHERPSVRLAELPRP